MVLIFPRYGILGVLLYPVGQIITHGKHTAAIVSVITELWAMLYTLCPNKPAAAD